MTNPKPSEWTDSRGYEYEGPKELLLRQRKKSLRNDALAVIHLWTFTNGCQGYIQAWVNGYDQDPEADLTHHTRRRNAEIAAAEWRDQQGEGGDGSTGAGTAAHVAVYPAV